MKVIQRLFDILVSFIGLIVVSPIFILIAVVIKISSQGPVFYHAIRMGRDQKVFTLYKFRSMVSNAHLSGPGITVNDDPRITCIGKFLRRSKLDEIPQLYNVLRGDMSIVGPRPEDPHYVTYYTEEQKAVLNVKPGITSPASIRFRHEESMLSGSEWETHYINKILPDKLAIELEYIQHQSLTRDIKIIFLTLLALLR